MAGVKATVTSDIEPKLQALIAQVEHPAPLFAVIYEYLLRSTRERFVTQTDPEGKPWEALTPRYKKRKPKHKDKILTLSGDLRNLMRGQYNDEGLEFGTDRKYGALMQLGGSIKRKHGSAIFPSRKFLGFSEADNKHILMLTNRHLQRSTEGKN